MNLFDKFPLTKRILIAAVCVINYKLSLIVQNYDNNVNLLLIDSLIYSNGNRKLNVEF